MGRILIKFKGLDDLDSQGGAPSVDLGSFSSSTITSSATDTTENEDFETEIPRSRRRTTSKIIPSLSALGVYMRGTKFRNFALPESKTYNHIFSFSERTFNSALKDGEKAVQLHKHNTR